MLVNVSWKVYGTDSQYWQHMVDQLFPNSANYHSTINLIFKDGMMEKLWNDMSWVSYLCNTCECKKKTEEFGSFMDQESYEDCCLKESLRKQCNLLNCVYSIEISQHGLDSL
ncbi:hypothetical protein ACF0H5_006337 [Mactra antiquata]